MSAKRKGKRAKEKTKLKADRRAAAKPIPLLSEDRQRHIGPKKKSTVPEKYGQHAAVDEVTDMEIPPPVQPFDQLEQIAAREKPTAAGAWWIALQSAHHVIECAAERDMYTGESLPRPLSEVLKAVADATKTGTRPIPNDRLHRAAVLAFEPLRTILDHPRTRLLREREQRPIHNIREMDTHCMAWLARLPGRTIREKLAGKQHALSVVRRFTPDTPENRVAKRVVDILVRRLGGRFEYPTAYDEDGPCDFQQRETLDFCRRALHDQGFGSIPPSDMPRPNNALLGDRLYSRVWRAWMLLHGEEDALQAAWPHAEECFRTAAFWTIASEIATKYNARVVEELVVPDIETVANHKCSIQKNVSTAIAEIDLLVMSDDASQSGIETTVISIQQVQGGIRIAENRLRAQKNSTGRVKFIENKDNKRFGFIRGESGEDYYFNPITVGDEDTFSSLYKGNSVIFTPGKRGTRPNVSALKVHPYEPGLRVAHVIEKGTTTWRVEFDDDRSEQSDFQRFRGFPVHATPDDGQRATATVWRRWADIEGLRDIANAATPSLNFVPKVHSASGTPSERIASKIGIDPFGRCIFVGTKEEAWSTTTLPYALRHRSQWQVGTSHRLPSVGTLHPLDTDLRTYDAAEESTAISSYHQIVRALSEEVHTQEMSFVVPDKLDEFSQQILRAAMLGAFPRGRPVARSVAAALAWQHQREFSKREVRDGDAVLVLCAEADALTFSLLVARHDWRLEEELPESGGIFWERRPALPAEEYGEGLGWRHIWRDYARRLFKVDDRDESYRDEVISYIVDSGLLQEAIESGSPRWIRDRDRWLVLEHSPQHWAEVLRHWRRRFDRALKSGLGKLISKAMSGYQRCHLLLVGPPFNERAVFDHIGKALSQIITHTQTTVGNVDRIASEKGELAVGAAEFTERSCAGLPTWKDWLPDLFLEIIQGGFYDEVELMRDAMVDATLGAVRREKVAEELVLPAGYSHYTLPIVTGRANRRPVSSDLRLDSASFPLQHDVRIQLELSYQYGVENGYELKVIPVEPKTAPFSELKGKWVRAGEAKHRPKTNPVPDFRPPGLRNFDLDKELMSYLPHIREKIKDCVSDSLDVDPYESKIKRELESDEFDSVPEYYANAAGILHRIEPNKDWIDLLWKKVIKCIEPCDNPQLYGASIYEIARSARVLPDFLEEFANRNPDFVQKSLHVIERGVRDIVSKAAQALDPDSEVEIFRGHVKGFQSYCELVLALLRLPNTRQIAGTTRMSLLAKNIRRADCLLKYSGKEVRTSLYFDLKKPQSLARVSNLAYYANHYLLGDVTMNLARISSADDDE